MHNGLSVIANDGIIKFNDSVAKGATSFNAQTSIKFDSTKLSISGDIYPKTTETYELGSQNNKYNVKELKTRNKDLINRIETLENN